MPYYAGHMEGDPGLFHSLFKKLKHIQLGRFVGKVAAAALSGTPVTAAIRGVGAAAIKAEKGRFLSRFGYRPSSPAPGAVTKVQAIIAHETGSAATVAPTIPQASRFLKARRRGARAHVVKGRVKFESAYARRKRLGLI